MTAADGGPNRTVEPGVLLQQLWDLFVQHGRWPTTRELDRVLYRKFHVYLKDAVADMPEGRLWPEFRRWNHVWEPDDNTTVSPTVAGLNEIDDARQYVGPFLQVLRYLVARAADFEPPEPGAALTVTSQEIAQFLDVSQDDVVLRVIERLLNTDASRLWQGMGSSDGRWSITLNEFGSRHYDKLESVDQLIALQTSDRAEYDAQLRAMRYQVATLPEVGPPLVEEPAEGGPPDDAATDPTKVFVVHGRNLRARDALYEFLESIGLQTISLETDAARRTGSGALYVREILNEAFKMAKAVIVLFTPDEVVNLRPELATADEDRREMFQSRANVYVEAGMAFVSHPRQTVLVELGEVRIPSDLGGMHRVRLNDTPDQREMLISRLEAAGCVVTRSDRSRTAGSFLEALEPQPPPSGRIAFA
jgi:predicted nucleotide-binding protein